MIQRNIVNSIHAARADTPVLLLNGARQTGKTTLTRRLAAELSGHYLSLDEPLVAAAATADPDGFVQGLQGFTVLDEVQQVPKLFAAIKREVDRRRELGRFLLTGSANIFLLPKVAESLAGRMEVLTLYPFSQGELSATSEDFVAWAFSGKEASAVEPIDSAELRSLLLRGGYPEVQGRLSTARRGAWFDAYLQALLQRDLRDLSLIEGLSELPRLLQLLAARSSCLLNMAELSRSTGIAHSTLRRYLSLLEATYLYQPLPAWSANLGKRLVKSAKIHLQDTGLALRLLGRDSLDDPASGQLLGPMLESFARGELRKQLSWSSHRAKLFHYRSSAGKELDLILEDAQGRVVAIEVKSTVSVSPKDFKAISELRDELGDRFVRGILLHAGRDCVPLGDRMWALPVSSLWQFG